MTRTKLRMYRLCLTYEKLIDQVRLTTSVATEVDREVFLIEKTFHPKKKTVRLFSTILSMPQKIAYIFGNISRPPRCGPVYGQQIYCSS